MFESVTTIFVLQFGLGGEDGECIVIETTAARPLSSSPIPPKNAGGEDFGYFTPQAVKNPPSIDRTVESARWSGCVAGSGEVARPILRFDCRKAGIARSPA